MKKIIIFIIMAIIIFGFLSVKKAYAGKDPDFSKLQTVENLNMSKGEIFDQILHWFNAYYTSPNKTIKFSNRDIGEIIVCSEFLHFKGIAYRSKITVLIKDNSYKLMLEPIPHGNIRYKEWSDEYYTEFDNIKKNLKEYLSEK